MFGPARVCGSALHASPARPRGCRGPASRLSASQPFPQFERAAGFTGFTLTPLTPRTRPPTATHPASGQWRRDHVPITHRLACDWPRPATPLLVIGCVLPPARLLAILFLCFFRLFFFRLTQLQVLLAAARPERRLSHPAVSARRCLTWTELVRMLSCPPERCCQVSPLHGTAPDRTGPAARVTFHCKVYQK